MTALASDAGTDLAINLRTAKALQIPDGYSPWPVI